MTDNDLIGQLQDGLRRQVERAERAEAEVERLLEANKAARAHQDQDPYGAAITTGVLLFGLVGFGLVLLSIAGCTTPEAAPAKVYTLPDYWPPAGTVYDERSLPLDLNGEPPDYEVRR